MKKFLAAVFVMVFAVAVTANNGNGKVKWFNETNNGQHNGQVKNDPTPTPTVGTTGSGTLPEEIEFPVEEIVRP